MPEPLASRLAPVLVLVAAAALGGLAWWLFPAVAAWSAVRDCIALGHTNCG